MIKLACPHCGKSINAPDSLAGKKGRCPGCQGVVLVEDPEAVLEVEVVEEPESPVRKAARRPVRADTAVRSEAAPVRRKRVVVEEEPEEVAEADVVDEEEERPRRRKRRRSRGPRGPYADCPECGCRGDASKIYYTWWGGFVGPLLLSHVRCNRCDTAYNGRSGNYNTTGIVLFIVISTVIGLAIGLLVAISKATAS